MMKFPKITISVLLWVCLWSSGCGQKGALDLIPEVDEPSFRRGKQYLREDRHEEALGAFFKVIDKRKRAGDEAPEAHLEVGILYLEYIQDPVASIFHLREYLRLMPDSPQVDRVEDMIKTAQKEFAKTLPGRPYNDAIDRLDLMDLLKQVREENHRLKNQIVSMRQNMSNLRAGAFNQAEPQTGYNSNNDPDFYTPPSQVEEVSVVVSTSTPSTYTVQSGDSLFRISAQVYGNGSQWRKIFEANRDRLSSPQSIKPGMELRIPPNSTQ